MYLCIYMYMLMYVYVYVDIHVYIYLPIEKNETCRNIVTLVSNHDLLPFFGSSRG